MNATAERLDRYLHQADPVTAHTVEKIIELLMQRFQTGNGGESKEPRPATGTYRIKTHRMGAFQSGFDPHKLGQLPEDY